MQIAFGIMTRSDKVSKLKEASIQVWTKTVFMRLQGAVHMPGKPRTLHFELTAATLLRETDWIGIGAAVTHRPPSRPRESHPEPLTDPDVSLSTYPARATQ